MEQVRGFLKNSDLLMGVGVIFVVVMMVIPLPPELLSLLQSLNLTLSLVILLVTLYTVEPLEFSIFPSLLLLATMFRLALNVSSTRLILLEGYAGAVIQTFGEFVVGGSAVVGFIVFLILVIIQFIVITRGSERVAEVAARFTLDAMPGKQMSIDADLNAGLIGDAEARRRRREIEREADFYGAMDGASKFVKGDAIAALIITAINILGGFTVGIAQLGMDWQGALQTFTLLTVGDGLVSQIPALLISTATGIIVTRAASDADMGSDLVQQVMSQPRALWIAAATTALFSLVPGMPKLSLWILAAFFAGIAYVARTDAEARARTDREAESAADESMEPTQEEELAALMTVDPLEVELGYGLLPLADGQAGGDLIERIGLIRRQLAGDLGLVLPLVRVRDNMQLGPQEYELKLWGSTIGRGTLCLDQLLAMDPGTGDGRLQGTQTREPAFGLPALWIAAEAREEAELSGYTVVDPPTVLATHLTELVKRHAHELLSRQEVKRLLDQVRETAPVLVDELVPNLMSTGEIQKVLQSLLHEGIPIRNLPAILEALADHAPVNKHPHYLTEQVRAALRRQISAGLPIKDGVLKVITLAPELEAEIRGAAETADTNGFIAIDPDVLRRMLHSLEEQARRTVERGLEPVVLCAPLLRVYFKRLTERAVPSLPVVSYNEIDQDVTVESIGMVTA